MRKTTRICSLFIAGVLAVGIAARGQEKDEGQKPAGDGLVRKVIPVKYVYVGRIEELLSPISAWGAIKSDDHLKVITVVGSAATVAAVEEAVKKLDVPQVPAKEAEITAYFLSATREPSQGADLPPALNEVATELKKVLNYRGFTLLNTALIRTVDGEGATVKGVAGSGDLTAEFSLAFQALWIPAGENAALIRLRNLDFRLWSRRTDVQKNVPLLPVGKDERENVAVIHTDVNLPLGQKVVVGKTALASPDSAIILVLSAQVMD